jgi:hypothetical protein
MVPFQTYSNANVMRKPTGSRGAEVQRCGAAIGVGSPSVWGRHRCGVWGSREQITNNQQQTTKESLPNNKQQITNNKYDLIAANRHFNGYNRESKTIFPDLFPDLFTVQMLY